MPMLLYWRCTFYTFAGTSTPPGISATAVPSIAAPIGVNGFSTLPPQSNGQHTSEPIYTNGLHPYPGESIKTDKQLRKWDILCIAGDLRMFDYFLHCSWYIKDHHSTAKMKDQHDSIDMCYFTWNCLKADTTSHAVFSFFLAWYAASLYYHDESISSSISPLWLIWCVSTRPQLLNVIWDWFLQNWQTLTPRCCIMQKQLQL